MVILITAAALAAQPAPAMQQAPMSHGQMGQMQHEQHEGMKKDCCKDCCKDMDKGEHAQPQRGE
jgi:hypothetical protein